MVNDRFNVLRADNSEVVDDVWAIGDACVLESGRLPVTAQGNTHAVKSKRFMGLITGLVAYQEAKYVAKALDSIGKYGTTLSKPFEFTNLGMMAYIGDWYVKI